LGEDGVRICRTFPIKTIDGYLVRSFHVTPLLMNFDEEHALAYGTQRGAGWRLDCLGDLRHFSDNPYFSRDVRVYPQQVVRAGFKVWHAVPFRSRHAALQQKEKDGFDVEYILAQALRWHVSTVTLKVHQSRGVENAIRFSERWDTG